MKKMKVELFVYIIMCLALYGCGKEASLPVGSDSSEAIALAEGRFDSVIIETSFLPQSFSVTDSYCGNDEYVYLISGFDEESASYHDYIFAIDDSGSVISSAELSKPIEVDNNSLRYSDICNDLDLDLLPAYDYLEVYYSDYSFDDLGNIISVCDIYGSVYSELLNDYYYDNKYFNIKWNVSGDCISAEPNYEGITYDTSSASEYYFGNDGRKYSLTSSGIILLDDNGDYSSDYFNFINSDILSYGFSSINILDNDHFSGVYKDADFNSVLCCFVRNKSSLSGIKPLVIACDDLSLDLMRDVIGFNAENNEFKIAVDDFSDRSGSNDPIEGWSILKDEISVGYSPDIIINTSGYDAHFIEKMTSSERLVDLKDVIRNDETLKDIKITDKAKSLFYSGEGIYAVVPAYTYRTIVGSTEYYAGGRDFSYDGFLTYADSLAGSYNIFRDDYRSKFMSRFLSFNGYEFVDYENRSSSFDSDVFVKYLELCSALPEDLTASFERPFYNNVENYYISDVRCTNLGDFNLYSTIYSMNDYVDLGFPSNEGKGAGVLNATESFMILSGSKYTNECWDIIKKYLGDEYQTMIFEGVPVTQNGYIVWKGNTNPFSADNMVSTYYRNGQENIVNNPDDSKVNLILDNIKSCERFEFIDYRVEQIVLEYAEEYFDGHMTSSQAASSIDAAVDAYLQTA